MKSRRFDDRLPGCSMEAALNMIGGKWKGVILHHLLLDGTHRFNVLLRKLSGVTQRMLVKQLRELEESGLIRREVYAEVPPRVEYSLTELGGTLEPILIALDKWGSDWLAAAPDQRVRGHFAESYASTGTTSAETHVKTVD